MPKRGTSGGIHFRGLAPWQHSCEETSQRWRAAAVYSLLTLKKRSLCRNDRPRILTEDLPHPEAHPGEGRRQMTKTFVV